MNYVLTWQLWIQGLSLGSYFCNTSHVAWRFSLRADVTRMCPSLPFFIVKPILPILMS